LEPLDGITGIGITGIGITGIGTGTSETERCLIVKPKEQNRACSESAIARKGAIKQNDR